MDKIKDEDHLVQILEEISKHGQENEMKYSESGDYDKAAEEYGLIAKGYNHAIEIINENSKDYSLMKRLITTFESTAKYWEKQAETARRESSYNKVRRYTNIGSDLQSIGNYEQSIKSFDNAINERPSLIETVDIWNKRGNSYYYSGKFKEAKKSYEKALYLDPHDPLALGNLGLVSMALEDYDKAIEYYIKAIAIDRPSDLYLTNLGIAYYYLGKNEEAREYLSRAIKINPNSVDAYMALGAVYNDGFLDYQMAETYFSHAMLIDPNSILAQINLSEVLLILDRYDESEKIAKSVRDSGNENYGFVARLLLTCSLYLHIHYEKAGSATLDTLRYYESLPSKYEIKWNFNTLRQKIEKESKNIQVREILLALISLQDLVKNKEQKKLTVAKIKELISGEKKGEEDLDTLKEEIPFKKMDNFDISIENISKPDPDEYGYYFWEIYLVASENVLSQINKVIYYLHPTFLNPVQVIDRKKDSEAEKNGFRLKRRGWGEFQITIKIILDDKCEIMKYHWLKLSGPTPLDT